MKSLEAPRPTARKRWYVSAQWVPVAERLPTKESLYYNAATDNFELVTMNFQGEGFQCAVADTPERCIERLHDHRAEFWLEGHPEN